MRGGAGSALGSIRSAQVRRIDAFVILVGVGLVAGLLLVVVRVGQLQMATPARLAALMDDRSSAMALEAPRGDIRDRRGRLLAVTRPGYRLFIDPHAMLGLDEELDAGESAEEREAEGLERVYAAVRGVSAIVDGGGDGSVGERIVWAAERARERVRRAAAGELEEGEARTVRYVPIGGVLSDGQTVRARRLAAEIRGVHVERVAVREHPLGDAAASVVGKVGFGGAGLLGAELAFDARLQPRTGHIEYVRDAKNRPLWVDAGDYQMPARGMDVSLSIDLRLQEIALEELRRGIDDANAAGGRLVMVDPSSGEVLAMADVVRTDVEVLAFDGELATRARREDLPMRFETLAADPGRAVHPALGRNRCVEHVYEPGSTFKAFMWSAAVAHGVVEPEEVLDTGKGMWRTEYGRLLEDVHPHDELTWADVLVFSSNIGMAQGVERLTHGQAREAIRAFGFGDETGLGLAGETAGLVTPMSRWSEYTQTSVSMGYEVGVTPVQMVRAFSVFARDGVLAGTLPRLRLTALAEDGFSLEGRVLERVLEPGVARLARETMVRVSERMLANMRRKWPDEPGFEWTMFGKSGTAEIARPDGRGYFNYQYNSSFVAGAPVDEPRLVIVVVIDDPDPELARNRQAFGSQVAGPVVARVLRRGLEYLGVPAESGGAGVVAAR